MLKTTDYNIIWHKKIDSTSAELHRLAQKAKSNDPQGLCHDIDGTVVAAEYQENGRGQADHLWLSEEGKNLLFSIFLEYSPERTLEAVRQELLTMAASLSVCDFLSDFGIEAKIKKPNDIYVADKKICGMLIENSIQGRQMNWSIVGMGVNINQTEFPENLPNPVSVKQLTGKDMDIEKCLNKLLRHFSVRFDAIWSDPVGLEGEYTNKSL